MKRLIRVLATLSLCYGGPAGLVAAVFTTPIDDPFAFPRQVEGRYLDIGRTDFADDDFVEEKIEFQQWNVEASGIHCIGPGTGLLLSGAYYDTTFRWINSPYFTQSSFPEAQLMLGAFTGAIPCWIWRGAVGISLQTQRFSIGRYGTFRGFLWGRYTLSPKVGFHAGFLFSRGLRDTFVFPILGIDWQICPNLRLDAVFPLNVALRWRPHAYWMVAAAGRWLRTRLRADNSNPLAEGLFEYRTWGAEGRIGFHPNCCAGIELFGGAMIWGWTRVENPTGTSLEYRDTKGAPYIGAEGYVRF